MTFITGAFTATYAGYPLGSTEEGFEQITSRVQEEIRVDQYRGVLDGVFQGIDMQLRMVLMELDLQGVRRLLWPYDHNSNTNYAEGHGWVGPIGKLMSSMAAPLVLTPCAGTTAKTVGNSQTGGVLNAITFHRCVLAAESTSIRYSSSLRKYPVTLQVLPLLSNEELVAPTCDTFLQYYSIT